MPAPESVFLSTMGAGPLSWSPDDVQKSQIKQHSSQLLGPKPPWRVGRDHQCTLRVPGAQMKGQACSLAFSPGATPALDSPSSCKGSNTP